MDTVRVQTECFDVGEEVNRLSHEDSSMGAVVSFIGMMRDMNEGDAVSSMTLEHYPGMTEKMLKSIIVEARSRWRLGHVLVIHRVGKLLPSESIVLVAVSSEHRSEAFDACEFMIDFLKTKAPFWKKETTSSGDRWVEERQSDSDALNQWSQ